MEKIEENISKNLKLFGTKKSKLIDRQISNKETPSFVFMMRAANAAKNFLLMRNVKNATIFVGKGNNGEDGFCLAALLKIENIPVEIIDLSYKDRIKTKSFKLCADLGVVRKKFGLDKIKNTDWYVDAIIGTGFSRELEGNFLKASRFLSSTKKRKILALDVPTGIDASKGVVSKNTVKATATITFLTLKPGLFFDDSVENVGDVYLDELGVSKIKIDSDMMLINKDSCHFPLLKKSAHKGTRGSVLCLGGCVGMEGAGIMAGISSLRSGAGKLFWATDTNSLDRPPELIQVKPIISEIKKCLDKHVKVAIIGPGLGIRYDQEIEFLWNTNLKLILDADGLRWLARRKPKKRKAAWLGTPHFGETKALLANQMNDKWSNIINLKKKYGGDWLLKGPGCLVSENNDLWLSNYSNGWLGTAGMGDVLTGMVSGLWVSGSRSPFRSSVLLQKQCAIKFLEKNNGAGLTASDISDMIGSCLGLVK